jgi:stringent starvation protein B
MTSLKPYLIRAVYDWIVDNNLTPYLLVNADARNVVAPMQYAEEGRLVLNLRPQAVHGLALGDRLIEFNARFSGSPMHVKIPIAAVLAIYARENGQGMVFDATEEDETPPPDGTTPASSDAKPVRQKPKLRVVK